MSRFSSGKPVWGLDVAASAIKGVKMRAVGDRVEILDADVVPLEGEPVQSDSPGRDRRIWRGLQEFQARHGLGSARVAVGLPGSLFFSRPFSFPLVGTRTEEELARFELDQHIPFGLDAVLWDYELFESAEPDAREREGLLFAMKKEVLNNYFLSLAAARIEPAHVQAAPLALYHFIRYELDPQEPVLVMDIGALGASLIALDGPRYWLRTVNVGGEAMTTAIRQAFAPREVSRKDAEAIKMNLGRLTRRAEVLEKIERSLRGLVGQLRNGVEHVRREHKVDFERIILVGGGSQMYRLPRLLGEEVGARVVTPAGLGRRTDVADSVAAAYVNANLPSLATAIGLGLQALGRTASRVNMVGATLLRRRSQTMIRRTAVTALACAALLVICFGGFSGLRKRTVAAGVAEMKNTIGPVAIRNKQYNRMISPGKAEQTLETFRRMAENRAIWLTLIDKIVRMLPKNEKRSTAALDKAWLIRLHMKEMRDEDKPPDEKQVRMYRGDLEVGVLLGDQKGRLDFAKKVLVPPLVKDRRQIFRDVEVVASRHSPVLSLAGGEGPNRYLVLRLRFTMVPPKWESR